MTLLWESGGQVNFFFFQKIPILWDSTLSNFMNYIVSFSFLFICCILHSLVISKKLPNISQASFLKNAGKCAERRARSAATYPSSANGMAEARGSQAAMESDHC